MTQDTNHYQYESYTTGRKQDYGHHEFNDENGWVCYDWDRGEYTETMQMKKPLEGKGWKPFRVYPYVGTFEDFLTIEEATVYFDSKISQPGGWIHMIEVDVQTGKEIRKVMKYDIDNKTRIDLSQSEPENHSAPLTKELAKFGLADKVADYLKHTDEFYKELKAHTDDLKRKNRVYELIESIKYLEGDYVWVVEPSTIHTNTNMFNFDKTYIGARAKFNADGTDNRLQLTPETQIEIKQQHIAAMLYGNPANSYFERNDRKKKWWYKTSYHSDWFDEELIGSSKEELINRWRKKYEDLRDAYFENYYKGKEQERQRRIDDAKRILEQEGQINK